jgi:branched-chain amino acid transport system ATP-binding protein
MAKAVNEPTHRSLIADLFPVEVRASVYSAYELALTFGIVIAPAVAGFLAARYSWRTPFLLFAVPAWVMAILALRLKEPVRGRQERLAMGAAEDLANLAERPPAFGEAGRLLWNIRSLRRIWFSLPFFGVSTGAFQALISLYYDRTFHVGAQNRGFILSAASIFSMIGLVIGMPLAQHFVKRNTGLGLRLIAVLGTIIAAGVVGLAMAPTLPMAVAAQYALAIPAAVLLPTFYAVLSLVIPPRARAMGFSYTFLWLLPGYFLLPVIGGIGDQYGLRIALALAIAPIYLIGSYVIASAGGLVHADVLRVRSSAVAQAEARREREAGRAKLLLVRDLQVGYDSVQILFDINFEVGDGEIVALLGTNGAGKSTLLRAIAGLTQASGGAIIFDGHDISAIEPTQAASLGIVMMPGGRGVFPTLTVAENLKLATWLYTRDPAYVRRATEEMLEMFPVLRERWHQRAGNLSGGEQQMLSLSQAFIAQPKLLMIDELSLGLAPVVVEQLLAIVRRIHAGGTAIILVEQSVNVALTLAERAVFLEKGEVRFNGPTKDLLDRDDVLHSVFLEGAVAGMQKLDRKRG